MENCEWIWKSTFKEVFPDSTIYNDSFYLFGGVYLIDKKNGDEPERHRGTPITPFSLSKQMDYAISYFKHHSNLVDFEVILENALLFDPYKRTEFDTMVSFLILLAGLQEPIYIPPMSKNMLIKTYSGYQINQGNPALADF